MSTSTPHTRPRTVERRARVPRPRPTTGFTLVEVLLVIVIIGILAGLLLPAIGAAVRRAREATSSAEINQLAQALADFKSKYGDYPPSRILLVESGDYSPFLTGSSPPTMAPQTYASSSSDITPAVLAQRSVQALRKFWPRVQLNTVAGGAASLQIPGGYYDFNGNGVNDSATNSTAFLLDGRACLAFFLGGIPLLTTSNNQPVSPSNPALYGMTGFSRNPQNPFMNNIIGNSNYSNNRTPPLFEFKANRLYQLDQLSNGGAGTPGVIGYLDANATAQAASATNPPCYAYFSAYSNGAYDPNDVNVAEMDSAGNGPVLLGFNVAFPVSGGGTATQSPAPNPYTTSLTVGTVVYQNPQSFQIISPGADSFYGPGGQYLPEATPTVPVDLTNTSPSEGPVRDYEFDNLTNFHNGRLQ
jgi:general secretion pathway protein G